MVGIIIENIVHLTAIEKVQVLHDHFQLHLQLLGIPQQLFLSLLVLLQLGSQVLHLHIFILQLGRDNGL